ncbi:MAG: hypothetical protein RL199_2344 [Pseudomonadota bacterium]|jgi:cation diffusion facilitator CzcD-associated flavoprotein CzcO
MFDWLIVGGGVHGPHLSLVLQRSGAGSVRVLDPHEEPLAVFWRVTSATGMEFLRSPDVHHLDLPPHALKAFAKTGRGRRLARFLAPYARPGLALFRAHVDAHVADQGLDRLRLRGSACGLARIEGGWRVETRSHGELEARRLVLALGLSESPSVPEWAEEGCQRGFARHLFDPAFDRGAYVGQRVAVVGGGISAAQVACRLASEGATVTLLTRHAPRLHRFDSDPVWLGPTAMDAFRRERNLVERRRLIVAARHRGSMPPDVFTRLERFVRLGLVQRRQAGVLGARWPESNREGDAELRLDDGSCLDVERVVLATGLLPQRPGGPWLDEVVRTESLPCAPCGYPVVGASLEWAAGLHVTGPLAELELGPSSRNIAGARSAGERLRAVA